MSRIYRPERLLSDGQEKLLATLHPKNAKQIVASGQFDNLKGVGVGEIRIWAMQHIGSGDFLTLLAIHKELNAL